MCCPEGGTDTADTNHTITTVSLVGGGGRGQQNNYQGGQAQLVTNYNMRNEPNYLVASSIMD